METRELGDSVEVVFAWEESKKRRKERRIACMQTDTGAWHPACVGAS